LIITIITPLEPRSSQAHFPVLSSFAVPVKWVLLFGCSRFVWAPVKAAAVTRVVFGHFASTLLQPTACVSTESELTGFTMPSLFLSLIFVLWMCIYSCSCLFISIWTYLFICLCILYCFVYRLTLIVGHFQLHSGDKPCYVTWFCSFLNIYWGDGWGS